MKKFTKRKVGTVALAVGLLASAAGVSAGTSYGYYSTTVGSFNGSGYTSYQTKANSGQYGYLDSDSVGGSYVVDARMQAGSALAHGLEMLGITTLLVFQTPLLAAILQEYSSVMTLILR